MENPYIYEKRLDRLFRPKPMKWKHALKDGQPDDNQQVLISVEGIYYIATYSAADRVFTVYDDANGHRFELERHEIYWTEFNNPPNIE